MSQKRFVFKGPSVRLDVFLAKALALSRTQVQKFLKEGLATVAGQPAHSRRLLLPGEVVEMALPEFAPLPEAAAESVPILFEDDQLIVVNKPAGLVVHPAGPHRDGTLVQRLWPKLAAGFGKSIKPGDFSARPGVVHRLDRGTSGVMVIAKTPAAAENLSSQFAARRVKKTYWAVAEGLITADTGRVESAVGRSRRAPHRMTTTAPGRWSETEFRVLKRFPGAGARGATLLEVKPRTGRTHQIRVQMAALGHPLWGDKIYGAKAEGPRPLLHAQSLELFHPKTGKSTLWSAPAPDDFLPWRE